MPGIVLSTGYMPIIKNHSVFKIFLNIPYALCKHLFYILLSSREKQKENKYISNIMSIKRWRKPQCAILVRVVREFLQVIFGQRLNEVRE